MEAQQLPSTTFMLTKAINLLRSQHTMASHFNGQLQQPVNQALLQELSINLKCLLLMRLEKASLATMLLLLWLQLQHHLLFQLLSVL